MQSESTCGQLVIPSGQVAFELVSGMFSSHQSEIDPLGAPYDSD